MNYTLSTQNTNLDKIQTALGSIASLAYAPPHDYPMSLPVFNTQPKIERFRPETDKMRLYVHIPFCNYGCSFCTFAKGVGVSQEQMNRYVKALKKELEWIKPGTLLSQLFMGGGTPTVLPAPLLDEVLTAIFERMENDKSKVHTVETSPDSLTVEHIKVLQKHKIGRISMGIQSLDEEVLTRVNRQHSTEQTLNAAKMLVEAGFIVNVDLIYGLPGQTNDSFRYDMETLSSYGIHAFTLYNLRSNERTPIKKVIGDEERWNLARLVNWRTLVKKVAQDNGYTQTRWHTFKRLNTIAAKHDREPCFTYDGMGYQLGIGVSARSQLGYTLYRNTLHLNSYLERIENNESPVDDIIPLSIEDRKTQFIARSIGDGKTLNPANYETAFGCSLNDDFGDIISRLRDNSLIEDNGQELSMSELGKLVHDLVTVCFYPQTALENLRENETLLAS